MSGGVWLAVCLAIAPAPAPDAAGDRDDALQALPQAQRDDDKAREAFRRGSEAYAHGRLEEAIGHFETTFRYSGRPGPLFSLAQAHRHRFERDGDARQRKLAILRYRQYLELDPEGSRRVEAERWVTELLPMSEFELEGLGEPPPIFTRLAISSSSPNAHVRIDGGEPLPVPTSADVEPGPHRVTLEASGFHPAVRSVSVAEGSTLAVEMPLRPLEAKLSVDGPPGATVFVDGERVATLPMKDQVPVDAGEHEVGVARPGRTLFVRNMAFERGQAKTLQADLDMTGQRRIAFAAIGTGAAGAVASGVLLGLALNAQRQAGEIADRHAGGETLALDDELRRRDLVDRRDTFRTASIAAGVVGLALVGAGVILYVTDKPPIGSGLRRTQARVRVAPTAGRGVAGLQIRGRW